MGKPSAAKSLKSAVQSKNLGEQLHWKFRDLILPGRGENHLKEAIKWREWMIA